MSEHTESTAVMDTPIGKLTVTADERGLTEIRFGDWLDGRESTGSSEILDRAVQQLHEYFEGSRREFDLPLVLPEGDKFSERGVRAMATIPYGEVWTYGELAAAAGLPKASRAAGQVCATNPLPIIVPCHRVKPASGGVGNFGPGPELKEWLLRHESVA